MNRGHAVGFGFDGEDRERVSAFDPAHERIGRADARRGDGRGCCDARLHRSAEPLDGDHSFSRHGRRVGKTPTNG